jgi:hypothetical protein
MPPDINDIFEMDCFKEIMDRSCNMNKSQVDKLGKILTAIFIGMAFGGLFALGIEYTIRLHR